MNAKKKLVKDILMAVIGYGIMWILVTMGEPASSGDMFGAVLGAGIIFGWRLSNGFFVPITLWGLAFKFIISVLVGIIAMPYAIVSDIVNVIREHRREMV